MQKQILVESQDYICILLKETDFFVTEISCCWSSHDLPCQQAHHNCAVNNNKNIHRVYHFFFHVSEEQTSDDLIYITGYIYLIYCCDDRLSNAFISAHLTLLRIRAILYRSGFEFKFNCHKDREEEEHYKAF